MAEEDPDTLQACWTALGAVTATIPKEVAPSHVRCVKDAVAAARDRQKRKRAGGDPTLPGFCLPKALTPLLPIYLQALLQVLLPDRSLFSIHPHRHFTQVAEGAR